MARSSRLASGVSGIRSLFDRGSGGPAGYPKPPRWESSADAKSEASRARWPFRERFRLVERCKSDTLRGQIVPTQLTRSVRVSVESEYCPERSDASSSLWFFLYNIVIKNEGRQTVQLLSRHWVITDAHGEVEEVRGPGVIGQQPILREGEAFAYTSGCPLKTPFGSMQGTYQMSSEGGEHFEVQIPPFALRDPSKMQ